MIDSIEFYTLPEGNYRVANQYSFAGIDGVAAAALEIRIHLIDGSVDSFARNDAVVARHFWANVQAQRLFKHARLMVADESSKTVYVPAHVNRVDFIGNRCNHSNFPGGFADVVELTEAEFREQVHPKVPGPGQKSEDRCRVGAPITSLIDLSFLGGLRVFLRVEGSMNLQTESQGLMDFLVAKSAIAMRLRAHGIGILNLANLVRFSVYTAAKETPEDAWMLSRVENPISPTAI